MAPVIRILLAVMLLVPAASAGEKPRLGADDRARIVEARRLAAQFGDDMWPGWSGAPFAVLLVTRDSEFLIGHPRPSDDFVDTGYDDALEGHVFTRERQFDPGLLATFPAVGGVPTIVIGQPQNTEASTSTRWVLTMLHEHFHQWQMSQSDYYPATLALGLAGDDTSGMWMLRYPFPYDSLAIDDAFSVLGHAAAKALEAEDHEEFQKAVYDYLHARGRFKSMLSDNDYKYFSFQLWQEGIPRYTEYRIAQRAAGGYEPSDAFEELPDFVAYADEAGRAHKHLITQLQQVRLRKDKRSAFYAIGAAEGLMLDRLDQNWRQRYFTDKFFMEKYFEAGLD